MCERNQGAGTDILTSIERRRRYDGGMSLNHTLADLFANLASIMDIKGENSFKAIAFAKVGRLLKDMTFDVSKAVEDGSIKSIKGVGESSRKIIEDFVRTGRSTDYDEVAASVPAGLLEMMSIPGLGPKTIALVWKERGITSVAGLSKAIEEGKLDGLKGMGEKKIESIKQGIAIRSTAGLRTGIVDALPLAESFVARVRAIPGVKQAEYAGSLRRRRETVGDLDLICTLDSGATGESVSSQFVKFAEVERILGQGATKASVLTAGGLQVDLRVVPQENLGAALLYFTGSKDHNVRLRSRAQDAGMTLNEWGLYELAAFENAPKKTGHAPELTPVASRTEADVYKKLGLDFIPPELREDRGEIDLASEKKLPRLIELGDLRGDLHLHTTASDGVDSIDAMIEGAIALGYEFLCITDHSKSQTIANGLTAERLLKHVKEIHKAAEKYKKQITVWAGSEVDILADGHLDYEDAVLAELDFVVASPHVALRQEPDKATDRIMRAIENRYVNVIGHPTGRLIDQRLGLPLDFSRVFEAAKQTGTALEINSGYPRLDLNDVQARGAKLAGVKLSINTDAHSIGGLGTMPFGLNVARRAGLEAGDVINCMSVTQLSKFVEAKRSR